MIAPRADTPPGRFPASLRACAVLLAALLAGPAACDSPPRGPDGRIVADPDPVAVALARAVQPCWAREAPDLGLYVTLFVSVDLDAQGRAAGLRPAGGEVEGAQLERALGAARRALSDCPLPPDDPAAGPAAGLVLQLGRDGATAAQGGPVFR